MTIGDNIRYLRQQAGYTLDQLGMMCGTSKQTIYKYENGIITNIPLDRIEKIASALNTTPAAIMGWGDEDGDFDRETAELLQSVRERSDLRMLFKVSRKATPEVIESVVKLLKGLNGDAD